MGSDAVILDCPGRVVIGLFGKTVPKTAGKVFKISVYYWCLHYIISFI